MGTVAASSIFWYHLKGGGEKVCIAGIAVTGNSLIEAVAMNHANQNFIPSEIYLI